MNKKQNLIIKISTLILLIIGIAMLCPSAGNVHADVVNVTRNRSRSSVSVAIDSRIDLEITPSATGALSSATTNLTISTSESDGFRVFVSSNDSALKRTAHPEEPSISSITKTTTLGALPNNTWGIYLGTNNPTASSNFLPVTTMQTELVYNELANASGTYKFAIAAKANTSLPAGYYSNQLVFSVIAEASTITSLANATYMQDVTPEICSNSDLEVSYTLIDKRDDKPYKVAKLKDGNCWMQEDLKLSLSKEVPLTPEDSDVIGNWVPTEDTGTLSGNGTGLSSWSLNQKWYYQWNAATAGSGQDIITSIDAPASICPKGWGLPTHSGSGSIGNLISTYGLYATESFTQSPLYLTRAGLIYNGTYGYNDGIYYWAKRAGSAYTAYSFEVFIEYLPSYAISRDYGFTVRCIVLDI